MDLEIQLDLKPSVKNVEQLKEFSVALSTYEQDLIDKNMQTRALVITCGHTPKDHTELINEMEGETLYWFGISETHDFSEIPNNYFNIVLWSDCDLETHLQKVTDIYPKLAKGAHIYFDNMLSGFAQVIKKCLDKQEATLFNPERSPQSMTFAYLVRAILHAMFKNKYTVHIISRPANGDKYIVLVKGDFKFEPSAKLIGEFAKIPTSGMPTAQIDKIRNRIFVLTAASVIAGIAVKLSNLCKQLVKEKLLTDCKEKGKHQDYLNAKHVTEIQDNIELVNEQIDDLISTGTSTVQDIIEELKGIFDLDLADADHWKGYIEKVASKKLLDEGEEDEDDENDENDDDDEDDENDDDDEEDENDEEEVRKMINKVMKDYKASAKKIEKIKNILQNFYEVWKSNTYLFTYVKSNPERWINFVEKILRELEFHTSGKDGEGDETLDTVTDTMITETIIETLEEFVEENIKREGWTEADDEDDKDEEDEDDEDDKDEDEETGDYDDDYEEEEEEEEEEYPVVSEPKKTIPAVLLAGFTNIGGFSCFMDSVLFSILLPTGRYFAKNMLKKKLTLENVVACGFFAEEPHNGLEYLQSFQNELRKLAVIIRSGKEPELTCWPIVQRMRKCGPIQETLMSGAQQDDSEFLIALMTMFHLKPTLVRATRAVSNDKKNWIQTSDKRERIAVLEVKLPEIAKTPPELISQYQGIQISDYQNVQPTERPKGPDGQPYRYSQEKSTIIDSNALIFHVARRVISFVAGKLRYRKNTDPIIFKEYLENTNDKKHYALRTVTIHRGGAYGGHYTAYFKYGAQWFHYDDTSSASRIRAAPWIEVVNVGSKNGSLYIYYPV